MLTHGGSVGEMFVRRLLYEQHRCNYTVIMKASLIAIGNSRGVRIPKAFLEQAGVEGEVEMEVRGAQIVIKAAHRPRAGWGEAFARMASLGDDVLLDPLQPTKWDESEWES
jgi:antitoxin MazE